MDEIHVSDSKVASTAGALNAPAIFATIEGGVSTRSGRLRSTRKSTREAFEEIANESDPRILTALGEQFKKAKNPLGICACAQILSNIDKHQLTSCMHTITGMLDSCDSYVRYRALETLNRFANKHGTVWLAHDHAIVAKLRDEGARVCEATVMIMMQRLLAPHVEAFVALLAENNCAVHLESWRELQKMQPHVLSSHVDAIAAMLVDTNGRVFREALAVIRVFKPDVLAPHAVAIATKLDSIAPSNPHYDTLLQDWARKNTLEMLREMEPEELVWIVGEVAERFSDVYAFVQWRALAALSDVPVAVLAHGRLNLCNLKIAKHLQGKVMWYICRKLFWANWMLLWWNALVWVPGGRQAVHHVCKLSRTLQSLVHTSTSPAKRVRVE